MTFLKFTTAVTLMGVLTACGGSSTGGGSGGATAGASYKSLAADFNRIGTGSGFVDGTDVEPADLTELPGSGGGAFNGAMALVVGATSDFNTALDAESAVSVSDADALGEVVMNVSFKDGTVSGSATNFVESDGAKISGTLKMAESKIEALIAGSTAAYSGKVTGTLTDADSDTFALKGAEYLGFFSKDAKTTFGIAAGGMTSSVNGADAFQGVFVAEK